MVFLASADPRPPPLHIHPEIFALTNDLDLYKPIPEPALKNQAPPTGKLVLLEIDGIVTEYADADNYERAERFDNKLRAEIDWIEKFTSHAPSIGTHYEKILSELVAEYLPSNVNVGTGFIHDSRREASSPQIDLICYQDVMVPPIYRRGDFVIVQPESVIAVCEIKKTLKGQELAACIGKTIGCNMGWNGSKPRGVQAMSVFAYSSALKTDTIVRCVRNSVEAYLKQFQTKTKGGAFALVAVQQLCLPVIYLHDRSEFVSTSIERTSPNSLVGQVKVATMEAGGPNGIGPFFGSLKTGIGDHGIEHRDHCSSYFSQVVNEVSLDVPVILRSHIGSMALVRHFPDAKAILKKNRAYGAWFSAFEDPRDHLSLDSFANTAGFVWCIAKQATQQQN